MRRNRDCKRADHGNAPEYIVSATLTCLSSMTVGTIRDFSIRSILGHALMSNFLGDCCNSLRSICRDNRFLVRAWHALRAIKVRVWDSLNLHHQRGTTRINILTTFPLYAPNSAGPYRVRAPLAIQSINRVFPLLSTLAETATGTAVAAKPLESFPLTDDDRTATARLAALFRKYGSDKSTTHNYHLLYGPLLHRLGRVGAMLEIGLGTNHTDVVSNMGRMGSPGASLRSFRDFLDGALIYGADVDKRVLFTEPRIRTFFVDQTNPASFEQLNADIPESLDLIIDDGLHSPAANLATLLFALRKLRPGGWIVIEDIPVESVDVWNVAAALLSTHYEPALLQASTTFLFAARKRE